VSWLSRCTNVFRSRRVDRDLDDELRFHVEARIDEHVARGATREAAAASVAPQFGSPLRARESSRDVKLLPWLESLVRDARHALRVLRRDAAVTATAVLSLALAIGACSAAFSLIDALILRPLPVRDPDRLVFLSTAQHGDVRRSLLSYPHFQGLRTVAPSKIDLFSVSFQSLRQAVLPDAGGEEEKLRVQFVSGNAFGVLGIGAALGRVLEPADDVTPGGHPVAVVSHAFWTRRLGASPAAIGQWIQIEQKPLQIVGVAQAGFTGSEPGTLTDVWVPNMMWGRGQDFSNGQWNWLLVWGRLAPGADRNAVASILQSRFVTLDRELSPERAAEEGPSVRPALDVLPAATGASGVREIFARPLVVLAAIVAIVLLIACSNIANLLLARGAARDREMMLRASIGAGRGRLLQQVLVECAVLVFAAAILGLLFAQLAVPFIIGMLAASNNPVHLETSIDVRAVAFLIALGGLTTLLFGLAPAIRASRATPRGVVSQAGGRHTSPSALIRPLVALQVGFSLMVLFVAGLLLQSFHRLTHVDLGFSTERLMVVDVETREKFTPEVGRLVERQMLDEVRRLPGVQAASLSGWALFRGWSSQGRFQIPGRGAAQTQTFWVSPGFFDAMRIRILDGRELSVRDADVPDPTAVVVNEAFARRFFARESAVGQRLERQVDGVSRTFEIVGVAANARDVKVRDIIGPYLFEPTRGPDGALEVRTTVDASTLTARLRETLARVHPALRVTGVTQQSSLVGNAMLRERLLAVLSGFFAAVGLVLAAVGLYGVSSYFVVRRTREIGIRLALGARPAGIIRSVLGSVGVAAAVGATSGLAAGLLFARFVQALLFETEPLAAWSLVAPAGCLVLVVLAAASAPARRAARVDPVVALRTE